MSELALKRAVYEKLTLEPVLAGGKLQLHLSGVCDSFAVKPLGAYLDSVAAEVSRLGLSSVAIDVTRLSLLNSSSLKQFITFLRPMKSGESKCQVEFVVDDQTPWQRRCLAALARMCPNAVSLRDVGGGGPGNNPSQRLRYASATPNPSRRS
jgi:hypothetical protein